MRIVSGRFRGRTIDAPTGEGTRPTTDRVREALMSSLNSLCGGFEGARVLDAFAGSGALGFEAISRGAAFALLFERDRKAQKTIERNMAALKLSPTEVRLARQDVMKTAGVIAGGPFDIVFLDPPYAFAPTDVLGFVVALEKAAGLAPGAVVVYEHALTSRGDVQAAAQELGFSIEVEKKYGKTGVTMMRFNQ